MVAGLATEIPQGTAKDKRSTLAFRALVLFSLLYYARPEDAIPFLAFIPISKIVGLICVIGLIAGLSKRKKKMTFPLPLTFLLLLFVQMCFTIPFAFWRGKAFQVVFFEFSKGIVVAVLIIMMVESLSPLRWLIFVQAA